MNEKKEFNAPLVLIIVHHFRHVGAFAETTAVNGTLQGRAMSRRRDPCENRVFLLCSFGVAPIKYAGG